MPVLPVLTPAHARLPALPAVETLLERWVVHYYPQLPEGAGGAPHLSRSQLARLSPSTVYKCVCGLLSPTCGCVLLLVS